MRIAVDVAFLLCFLLGVGVMVWIAVADSLPPDWAIDASRCGLIAFAAYLLGLNGSANSK